MSIYDNILLMILTPWLWWRGLTKCSLLDKGMVNHFSILALRTEPGSPSLQVDSLPSEPPGKPWGLGLKVLTFFSSYSGEVLNFKGK